MIVASFINGQGFVVERSLASNHLAARQRLLNAEIGGVGAMFGCSSGIGQGGKILINQLHEPSIGRPNPKVGPAEGIVSLGHPTERLELLFSTILRTLGRLGLGHGHPQSSFQVPAGREITISA
jgi:hypothetical protein